MPNKNINCDCGENFISKNDLKKHKQLNCKSQVKYFCNCGKFYMSKGSLKIHKPAHCTPTTPTP